MPSCRFMPAVHPHACGEYLRDVKVTKLDGGSPPRVWGIRHWDRVKLAQIAVHPHACGEY